MVHGEGRRGAVIQKLHYSTEAWHDAKRTINFNGIRNRAGAVFLGPLQKNRLVVIY